jgi:RHS repeat-associated protein
MELARSPSPTVAEAAFSASGRLLVTRHCSHERLFYPFGELWQGSDLYSLNPHQTFGKLPDYDNDASTDLYNTLNRHYTPMGRWLSPDPLGQAAAHLDDPQTWNMYAYVRNNPTTLVDPLGLQQVVVECAQNMKTCVGAQEKPQPPTDKTTQKQESSTWEAPGVVVVQGTTTTSTDGSGNTTTTVTTTVALYSTEKGQEGTFQGATQWVNTTVTSAEGKVLSTTPSGRMRINDEAYAARSLGSEAINSAIAQTVPGRAHFFVQSAGQHYGELIYGAIAIGVAVTPLGPLEAIAGPKAAVEAWWALMDATSKLVGSN